MANSDADYFVSKSSAGDSSESITPYDEVSYTPPPPAGRPPNARMITTGYTPVKNGDGDSSTFDVVATYNQLLAEDPELTMPVAAIEALVHALAHTPATTVSETLDLLSTLTAELKRKIPNPISLSAGTDLFQRYIITTLQRPGQLGLGGSGSGDFSAIRTHLVQNGRLFVERAKEARETIARFGKHFVRDGNTVLTNGGSRVVGALLRSAAESSGSYGHGRGSIRFRVIYVVSSDSEDAESTSNIKALRKLGIPVATIPPTAIAYKGVVENGGIISRLGTYQMGMLAKAAGKPFYVVAESHKFVRLYPLGQMDLGIDQSIVEFKTAEGKTAGQREMQKDEGVADMDAGSEADAGAETAKAKAATSSSSSSSSSPFSADLANAVDFTPPNLISGIITESGVLLPSAVSEELIKIWF
ncbi:translation initiation factor eIF-2B subunit alpha [Taxawa tesnikishii (nom. ined.)]|nr:translation initiation factor eIF-2B subunit alpha [Dothideales sp. JES 119]